MLLSNGDVQRGLYLTEAGVASLVVVLASSFVMTCVGIPLSLVLMCIGTFL